MSRSRVQVLTLAELGFTMVFAIILLSMPQNNEVVRLRRELANANKALDKANSRIDQLEAELAKAPRVGRSNIPPPCSAEPLEQIDIVGPDKFLLGKTAASSAAIASKHKEEIDGAQVLECRHRVIVTWQPALSASDLDASLRMLERFFYIRRQR